MACGSCDKMRKEMLANRVFYSPKKTVYMDYNATTPVDPAVLGAFDRSCRSIWGNPSSLHCLGIEAFDKLEATRVKIADLLNIQKEGIEFCSGSTEALFIGMGAIVGENSKLTLISTPIEHSAVISNCRCWQKRGHSYFNAGVDDTGKIKLEELKRLVTGQAAGLFVYSPVNHETGTVQDCSSIYNICKENGFIVYCDGAQALHRMLPEDWIPYCDMFSVSGHKVYAPKGIGFLYIKPDISRTPVRFGGGDRENLFPGTPATPLIESLGAALELLIPQQKEELKRLASLSRDGLAILQKEIPLSVLSPQDAAAGSLLLALPGIKDITRILYGLYERNICISRFSACSTEITGKSEILQIMGHSEELSTTSLRVSLGRMSSRDDFLRLENALLHLL